MKRRTPLAFAATFVLFIAGITAGNQMVLRAYAAGSDPYLGLDVFSRAMTQIQRNHVEEKSTRELVWASIEGMADALDPHTMFFDPESYARILEDHEGRYYGVGLESVPAEGGGILVVEVIADSPAELAGVLVGDRIVAVDGRDITGMTFDEATALIKGPRGDLVTFDIAREGAEPLSLQIARDEIVTPTVTGELVAPGLAYTRIEQFREGCAADLEALMGKLVGEGGSLRGLILDLRGNPGGLLDEATAVVDLFVTDELLLVTTRGRVSEELEEVRTTPGGDPGIELVVLVDGDSASGSEIVAGAVQDLKRGTVVGQPTWGKGSVQRIYEYEDGSALKLTVARYYLPSGRAIDPEEGIVPDIIVDLRPPDADPAAELRRRIEGEVADEGARAEMLSLLGALKATPGEVASPSFRGPVAERVRRDGQLRKALELLQD